MLRMALAVGLRRWWLKELLRLWLWLLVLLWCLSHLSSLRELSSELPQLLFRKRYESSCGRIVGIWKGNLIPSVRRLRRPLGRLLRLILLRLGLPLLLCGLPLLWLSMWLRLPLRRRTDLLRWLPDWRLRLRSLISLTSILLLPLLKRLHLSRTLLTLMLRHLLSGRRRGQHELIHVTFGSLGRRVCEWTIHGRWRLVWRRCALPRLHSALHRRCTRRHA